MFKVQNNYSSCTNWNNDNIYNNRGGIRKKKDKMKLSLPPKLMVS